MKKSEKEVKKVLTNTYVITTDDKYLAVHENIGRAYVTRMEL